MTITLKNLEQATEQQIFDQVAVHLLTQNEVSQQTSTGHGFSYCNYRNPKGLKCAAGCLIADDEYLAEMDNGKDTSWLDLATKRNLVPTAHAEFIRDLQIIHDTSLASHWFDQLSEFAKAHDLNTDALKPFVQVF